LILSLDPFRVDYSSAYAVGLPPPFGFQVIEVHGQRSTPWSGRTNVFGEPHVSILTFIGAQLNGGKHPRRLHHEPV
jgi:hypothetical protein